jgi:MoaA/NifB/PqqE/SkfB family radical SAM enzyme
MSLQLSGPYFASWEATLRCNFRCSHCGLKAGKAKENELRGSEAIEMMDKLQKFGVKVLVISGGELTLRSDWREITEYALARFDAVRLITNGWMGKEFVHDCNKMINGENLVISVSLDGGRKIHNLRRAPGSFESVIELLKARSIAPKIVLTTLADCNFSNRDKLIQICLAYGVQTLVVQLSLPAGFMSKANVLSENQVRTLADWIYENNITYGDRVRIVADDCFAYLHPMRETERWMGCLGGKELITILADGKISGCPTWIDKNVGDIRKDSLPEIWNGDEFRAWRTEEIEECSKCRKCLGGCKAVNETIGRQLCLINKKEVCDETKYHQNIA